MCGLYLPMQGVPSPGSEKPSRHAPHSAPNSVLVHSLV